MIFIVQVVILGKITNRKEALAIRNKVCEVKEEYLKEDKCFDEFAKLEELTFEDDFCQYLIGKYAKLSRFYLDDSEEYAKEYGDENPSILCFNDILDYLDFTSMQSSSSCSWLMGEGDWLMTSRPELFFGKAMKSRMESAPAKMEQRRSKPKARPA